MRVTTSIDLSLSNKDALDYIGWAKHPSRDFGRMIEVTFMDSNPIDFHDQVPLSERRQHTHGEITVRGHFVAVDDERSTLALRDVKVKTTPAENGSPIWFDWNPYQAILADDIISVEL
jgi:hypothetical protein